MCIYVFLNYWKTHYVSVVLTVSIKCFYSVSTAKKIIIFMENEIKFRDFEIIFIAESDTLMNMYVKFYCVVATELAYYAYDYME